ncbi:malonate transporter MadM subunit [Runella defluvii]|uniref:Malonate transporter MadM subunit n=1 Tax=Runella defluvii TaxID=370973 RepID=A0A7W6EPP5_9BACT|nr:malonate transporter subunit MadM [Runella defluvii]MBB3837556.1 malonate transporter MadM subunit [Runella defluvii]
MEILLKFLEKNGLVVAFLVVGLMILVADTVSKRLLNKKVPTPAVAIVFGLLLAYVGGTISGGEKGIADVKLFSGMGQLGGSMFRDFAIVSTAFGASILLMRKSGIVGAISLIIGIIVAFSVGLSVAWVMGYHDAVSLTTIGAGACTYIVGPVTGAAIGASSEVIALSIATGVVKATVVAIATPLLAKRIGLDNPHTAMVFGGIMGTNAGVMAGLAATDPKLVPYGALTATFYTGLGCLLCPSVFYLIIRTIV